MPNRAVVSQFVKMVENGRFVEAMEEFYSPDATMQENNEPPRVGLPALLAHERQTLAAFGRAEARSLDPVIVDGDRVVIHWQFVFHDSAGRTMRLDELAYQTWWGDKLATERFFYDPRQLQPR